MSRFHKVSVLLRAVGRLSPRMALYMARRSARNRLAGTFPRAYRRRIGAIEAALPPLGRPGVITSSLDETAAFYCAEYRHMVADLLRGRVTLHGRTVDFGAMAAIDWNRRLPDEGDHQMWRVKLAHMGFVCPLLLSGDPAQHAAAAALVASAVERAPLAAPGAFNAFWFPYAASHRLLAIGSSLLVARHRGGLAPEVDAVVANFLQLNAAFVLDNVEHELCNNHVERNLAALCLYFSHVSKVPTPIMARIERDVAYLVASTVLPDGTQAERSPMYQGLSIVSLAVMADTPFLSAALRRTLAEKLTAARGAFAILCHRDGEVALFNDSWHGEVPHWDGEPAPDGRSLLPDGGYARLSDAGDLCLMDAGPIGLRWNPGHGHADFLSLEIDLAERRVIVDPGTSRYNSGPERARERSAAAHNGPIWRGHEPVQFLGCFKVGRMAEAGLVTERDLPADTVAGIFRDGPGAVARTVRHYPGLGFLVADLWDGAGSGQVTWLVPATWEVAVEEGGFLLRDAGQGARAVIALLSTVGETDRVPSRWACRYGHEEGAHALCLLPKPDASGRQTLLTWIGHAAPPEHVAADGAALLGRLGELAGTNRT